MEQSKISKRSQELSKLFESISDLNHALRNAQQSGDAAKAKVLQAQREEVLEAINAIFGGYNLAASFVKQDAEEKTA